jgi:hypothetical protein
MLHLSEVFDWARPLIERQDIYKRRNLIWNSVSVILASVLSILVYLNANRSESIVAVMLFLLGWLAVHAALKTLILKPVDLSLPDAYAVSLVRIIVLAQEVQMHRDPLALFKLDDTVASTIQKMDSDIYKMRDNLAASRTIRALRNLRSYMLRYSTVLHDPEAAEKSLGMQGGALPKVMSQTLLLTAQHLHDFYGLEHQSLPSLAGDQSLTPIREQKVLARSRSLLKIARGWYKLPAPINVTLFSVLAILAIWGIVPCFWTIDISTKLATSVVAILGFIGLFQGSLREWLKKSLFSG